LKEGFNVGKDDENNNGHDDEKSSPSVIPKSNNASGSGNGPYKRSSRLGGGMP
jgi:hypothetical protein